MTYHYTLANEEVKALKLFTILFYVILFAYDTMYFYVYPEITGKKVGLPENGLGIWIYIGMILLLPAAIYAVKKGWLYAVKYAYFFVYIVLELINNLLIYTGTDQTFSSGNIVEVFFILFSSLFINKRYFWTVVIGLVGKYAFLGIVLSSREAFLVIILLAVFTIVSYILLARFHSYVQSITRAFENAKQAEQLAVIGRMATAIGHEVRNPLASLKGFTQLQQEKHKDDVHYYSIMIDEINRINTIVTDLMLLGKPKTRSYKKNNMKQIILYVSSLVQQQAAQNGVMLDLEFGENIPDIECNENQIKQVLLNIVKNGMEAMPNGGTIKVQCSIIDRSSIQIHVMDQGVGIPEDKLQRLGEPFFTMKEKGTGLGLMVTYKIIEEHGGSIQFDSKVGAGTRVTIALPVTQLSL